MAEKKNPDVVRSGRVGPEYPEGTHPARPASETHHAASKFEYRDLPDSEKPDPSTIAQEQINVERLRPTAD
jgi:hypothetical protein